MAPTPPFLTPPSSNTPPVRSRTVFARRILVAFVFLALGMGTALGVVGHLSFDYLGTYLVGWHARPVMETLIEAEKRAWEAEDNGRGQLYYGEDLATAMHWTFLVGKQVPAQWHDLPDGLHFVDNDAEFVLVQRRDGVEYMLRGGTGGFQALKDRLNNILLICALAGLAVAVLLAVVLSRRLTDPLRRLTLAVEGRPAAGMSRLGGSVVAVRHKSPEASELSGSPELSESSEAQGETAARPGMAAFSSPADIPMTDMDDEVGVLARAIAAREDALWRFVQRESHFTGDVSHELRTPLTVMQGGLEVMELRLQALPQSQELVPVVKRLLRTTSRMSDTVRTLLLLARRPEEILFQMLDCAVLLRDIIAEMEREGLVRSIEAVRDSDTPDAAASLAHMTALILRDDPSPVRENESLSDTDQSSGATARPSVLPRPFASPIVTLMTSAPAHAPVRAQRELATIILKNLLDNACKYTENNRAFVMLESGKMLVGNKGRTPHDIDIFARGVRCGNKTDRNDSRDGASNGLGLSLAQRACERLGWRLELLPSAYTGAEEMTVFRLAFPPAAQGENA